MTPLHRRPDGSLVVRLNGLPYHVTPQDPLFRAAEVAASGLSLPPEPAPPMVALPTPAAPTKAELMAQLQALQAQIAALAE